jgi:hypothetical protein
MPHRDQFTADDLPLLEAIVDAVPNLRAVALAAKRVRQHCKYPLATRAALRPVFEGKKAVALGDREVSLEEAELFIPSAFLPIDSERDLLCKLLIAFQIGDHYHVTQNLRRAEAADDTPTTVLPGPVFHPVMKHHLEHAKKEA